MKKIISIMLIFAILSLSLGAYATSTPKYSEGYMYYTVTNGSATIVDTFGSPTKLVIPSSIAGYPVNTIASGAFDNLPNGAEVTLPDTITSIEGSLPSGITVVYSKEETVKYVAKNTTTNVEYTTLEDALDKAKSGETVKLLENVDGEKYIAVEAGVTLDLNAKNITGAKLFYSSGNVIDDAYKAVGAATTRGIVSAQGYTISQKTQTYCPIPVYDSEKKDYIGYSFVYLEYYPGSGMSKGNMVFTLNITAERTYAYSLLKSDPDYTSRFKALVSVDYYQGGKPVQKNFIYSSDDTQAVVNSGGQAKENGFAAAITGIEGTGEMRSFYYIYDTNGNILFSLAGKGYRTTDSGSNWNLIQ